MKSIVGDMLLYRQKISGHTNEQEKSSSFDVDQEPLTTPLECLIL